MPGFYVNHLKSSRARDFAGKIEKRLSSPTADKNMKTVIRFPNCKAQDVEEVLSAGYAVLRDNPDFFYYHISLEAKYDGSSVILFIPLLYTLEQISMLKQQLDEKINSIINQIPLTSSLWEKERYIFEYLQLHTQYTKDGARERYNIIGCLLEQKAVCEGVSKAFAVLCHRIGIPCIVVFSETHMWNIVNINGKLANVDATYGTSTPHTICDYTYFNICDADLNTSIHKKELDCIPICTDSSNSFFHRTNTYFANEKDLKNHVVLSLVLKRTPIQVKLSNGNITKAMKAVALSAPCSFEYSYNEDVNTALITLN